MRSGIYVFFAIVVIISATTVSLRASTPPETENCVLIGVTSTGQSLDRCVDPDFDTLCYVLSSGMTFCTQP